MRRQMLRAFSVHKARAIVDIEVGPDMTWQLEIEARRKRAALIVIQKEITFVWWFEIGQAAGHSARAFGVLMGIDGVELCQPGYPGRVCGSLPSANAGPIDGKRKENIGVAQDVVIKEVLRAGSEVGNVEHPSGK